MTSTTAQACANIAFIKYWGNRDPVRNLPANGSISMNLDSLKTSTTVEVDEDLWQDTLEIDFKEQTGPILERVQRFLDHIRRLAGVTRFVQVRSQNNFPSSAGLASSASAFAALALAATSTFGLHPTEHELSALARLGSGSAARSIPGGFVEWYYGSQHDSSYAESIAGPDYWDLVDVIVIVQEMPKSTGSTHGHILADTSPIQTIRAETAVDRLKTCRNAILERNFPVFAEVVEMDSMLMHAAMMTSRPALIYWEPATLQVIKLVQSWRLQGLHVCQTIDAGANVHIICPKNHSGDVRRLVEENVAGCRLLVSNPGGAACLS